MEDFQVRVTEEKTELDGKIIRLTRFVFSDKFQAVKKEEQERMEQERMERQLYVMMDYSKCLKERIASF